MANTDRELKDATQVVYLKLLEKAYKNLQIMYLIGKLLTFMILQRKMDFLVV